MSLVEDLLSEQSQLSTPVAEFARKHDKGEVRTDIYKHLLPLDKPEAGEQYAFEVELDKCTACKACVVACHSLNGLEEEESWRDVGLLVGDDLLPTWQQTVTTACHHCVEPECMHGCPVKAYEKDEETGIVRHLDDQCIGCEYCSLKCPFDVPKYSHRLGIVRKCDMCYQRLAVGEAPACVQACPNEAIKITTVSQQAMRERAEGNTNFLEGVPDMKLTLPTTIYKGRQVPKNVKAVDRDQLNLSPTHWPLVLMLTLTQAGVGMFSGAISTNRPSLIWASAAVFFLGMSFAILHLGRPLGAWRFFLGLKTSWLSREILAFTLFSGGLSNFLILYATGWFETMQTPIAVGTILLGWIAVYTSAMIYIDTKRENWKHALTLPSFFGTALALYGVTSPHIPTYLAVCFAAIPLGMDTLAILPKDDQEWSPALHRARLLKGPLDILLRSRLFIGFATLLIVAYAPLFAILPLIVGEVLSRILYFKAIHSPKMPRYL